MDRGGLVIEMAPVLKQFTFLGKIRSLYYDFSVDLLCRLVCSNGLGFAERRAGEE